jgi:two-component system, NarL family, nitrate/nitrite response regulator NarP
VMASGGAGFCSKSDPPERLLEVAAAVADGQMVFPFIDVRGLYRDPLEELTEKERVMLTALAKGQTNNELAVDLGISVNTVKFHLRNLYDKLSIRNRSQAVAFYYSLRNGSPPE